jgi:hypothetical protein
MSKTMVIELSVMPLITETLHLAKDAVILASNKANVSSSGFRIDDSFCDFGEIETSGVTAVIDEAASQFGACATEMYNEVVGYLCDQITNHFNK